MTIAPANSGIKRVVYGDDIDALYENMVEAIMEEVEPIVTGKFDGTSVKVEWMTGAPVQRSARLRVDWGVGKGVKYVWYNVLHFETPPAPI